jgi:hypothetical protein
MMLYRQLSLTSQAVLRELGLRAAIVTGAAALIPGRHLYSLTALSAAAALYTAAEAAMARQRPWNNTLTQWDEAVAFAALAVAVGGAL